MGKTLRVGGRPFTVVGVFEKQGGLFGEFTSDTGIFIPLAAFEGSFGTRRDVTIQVRVHELQEMEDAKLELEGIMRNIRRLQPGAPNDFNINQQEIHTETFGPISLTISVIGLFITGLSLFVGGIGIMNIMFVSVIERTKEIGIRKAIGAPRRSILLQFLVESSLLCLLGGAIGLAAAFPLSLTEESVRSRFELLNPLILLSGMMMDSALKVCRMRILSFLVFQEHQKPRPVFISHVITRIKVANVPLIEGIKPPDKIFDVTMQKVGLTIAPERLAFIREKRMKYAGTRDYLDITHIQKELEYSQRRFHQIKDIQIIDVTLSSIEEVANKIIEWRQKRR